MNAETLKGHLDLLLLSAVRKGPAHGYAIIERLREGSGGAFDLAEGTVYPALHRLEEAELLVSTWETAPSGRKRRVYALSKTGRAALQRGHREWQDFATGVNQFLEGPWRQTT